MTEMVLPMKRRTSVLLALRAMVLLCALLAVAGLTYAWWSDSATSSSNTFKTGNLDLRLRPSGPSIDWIQGPVVATWHAENMYPGQELDAAYLAFETAGTIPGTSFDIAVANVSSVAGMDEYIEITKMVYRDGETHNMLLPTDPFHLEDTNGNGWIDLDDLEKQPRTSLPPPDTEGSLTMDFRFNENAGNGYQAANVSAEFTFTLHQ
jgi:predicted ribosomally synthesized peptide with SipW-like signal peptide